ncbi:hypothetical protein LOK49_LG05G01046 [Camellia lanceoleosa]|uniref:Uncharacterized protein n=1 Tax=Camellia lanceoleosa TaxID=1840588 RepID=A0ACC0HL38_9ERIC|nr:hypothetical protein LOK49_LG05G01046 [Camellia lanceoleosa]
MMKRMKEEMCSSKSRKKQKRPLACFASGQTQNVKTDGGEEEEENRRCSWFTGEDEDGFDGRECCVLRENINPWSPPRID